MRLASITFAPFGALRDVSLDFAGPAGALHVVWGPNEAGKSTALRGIVGFFFQIDRASRDQHTAGLELRVRARLELPDGTVAHLVRRKGTKDPLRDGDSDAPVSEHTLSRWMGGIDKATFLQLHALDHVRLREGSEAILRGHGRLGELLLEASAGAVGLSERLESLREEADGLFRGGRSKKTALALAIEDWKRAGTAVSTQALSHQAWKDQEAAIAELRQRVVDTEAQLKKAKEEHARLTRLADLGDPWRRLRKKRARRLDLGVVADVKEGTAKLRDALAQQLAEATADATKAADELGPLRSSLRAVSGRAASVSPAFDVAAGRELRARLDAARRARTEATADREAVARALGETLGRLGPAPADHAWSDFSIDARALSRAQARGTALRDADAALAQAARALAEARARRERLTLGPAQRSQEPSLAAREEALAAGRRAVAAARTRDDLAARELALVGRVAAAVAASGATDVASLVGTPCPGDEVLAAEERARAETEAELSRRLREIELVTEQARVRATELSTLREASALPTEEELASARTRRTALLDEVAAALEAGDARAAAGPLRAATHATHAADALADRLRREASRVERATRLEADVRHARDRLDALSAARDALLETGSQRRTRWDTTWPALAGLSSVEARAWAARRGEAAALLAEIEATRVRRSELDTEVEAALAALRRAGEDGALEGSPASLEGALARAERAAEEQRGRARAHDEQAATLAMAIDAESTAEREMRRAELEAASARRSFGETVSSFGLPTDVGVEEAMAVLSALGEVSRERRRQDALAGKIAALEAEEASAIAEWASATRETGLADVAPEEALALAERARDARAEVQRLEEAIATRVGIEQAAGRRADRAAAGLATIAEQAGVPAAQLAQAEERAREARALDQEIAQLEALVAERLGAASLAAAEEELRQIDLDLVDERLDAVAATLAELEATRDHAQRSIGAQELGLANLGSESRAAEQAENAEAHLARARALARRAAVAWAAVALLEGEVERHRKEREGPVLRRASELFRVMTLDRWEGLRVGEGEDGEPAIRCVRGQHELGVETLSVGTGDQLYLALRLAALEHHARAGTHLPVVLDDVLVHFDEDRKGAALEVLADVSRSVQVLLFSHDRRVADLAREVLGPDRVVVHELGRTP